MSVEIKNPANPSESVGTFITNSPEEVPGMMAVARNAQKSGHVYRNLNAVRLLTRLSTA